MALRYIRMWRATKDQQGCHHLRPTSQTMGYKANEGNLYPRLHVYATDYYCSLTTSDIP